MKNIIAFAYPKSNGFAPPIFDRDIGIKENDVKKFLNNPKNKNKVVPMETVSECMKRFGAAGGVKNEK
jgi:hypothetical protein